MKNTFLSIAIVVLSNVCFSQTSTWEKVEINNQIELSFPEKYVVKKETNNETYRCKLADGSATLSLTVSNLAQLGLTDKQLNKEATTSKFWDDYFPTLVGQVKDAKLVKTERKNIGNVSGGLATVTNGKNTIYIQVLIIGNNSYTASFKSIDGRGDEKLKDIFLSSINIKN